MMNIFRTAPKFYDLYWELKRYNTNEPAIMAAREAEDWDEERRIIQTATNLFADSITEKYKMTVDVVGEENLPDQGPVLIVGNHQSYGDVLMTYYAIRKFQIGFIAKSEFQKFDTFKKSIQLTRSLFIKRGDPREAVQTIREAADLMDKGFSFVIFPEGTRSHTREMGEFKHGSFKFAQKARVPIVPITLDGGYHLLEEHNSYRPCNTRVTIHPMVPFGDMDRHQQAEAEKEIEAMIRSCLEETDPI